MKNAKIRHCLLCFLLLPLLLSAQQKTFTHIHKDGRHHTDVVINYKTWNGDGWWAKVNGNTFTHARKNDFVSSHNDVIINYVSWDNKKWTAKVDGNTWLHAPNGDFSKAHQSKIINYLTPYQEPWTATFESYQAYANANANSNNNGNSSSNGITIIDFPPIITALPPPPPTPTGGGIIIHSLNDICPNASLLSLFKDLGLYSRLADIPTFDAAKAICPLTQEALDNYAQNLTHYKAKLPSHISAHLNASNLRDYVRNHIEVRTAVNGILFTLIAQKIANTGDQSTGAKAIRNWAATIYKDLNVTIAGKTLEEYRKWKINPCNYPGYRCPSKLGSILSAPKPPMKLIAENGFNGSFVNAASMAGAVTIAGGTIGVAIGGNLLAVALAPTGVSLFTTFGGSAGVAVGSMATVWAGPGAIIVVAVAAGILEAINVAAAADAERKLVERLNTASSENVNIQHVLQDKEKSSLLLTAFLKLANS